MALTRRNNEINALTSNLGNLGIGARLLPVLARAAAEFVRTSARNGRSQQQQQQSTGGGGGQFVQTGFGGTRRRGARRQQRRRGARQDFAIPPGVIEKSVMRVTGGIDLTKPTSNKQLSLLLYISAGDSTTQNLFSTARIGDDYKKLSVYNYMRVVNIRFKWQPYAALTSSGYVVLAYDPSSKSGIDPTTVPGLDLVRNMANCRDMNMRSESIFDIKPYNTNHEVIEIQAGNANVDYDQTTLGNIIVGGELVTGFTDAQVAGRLSFTADVICFC